MATTLYFSSTAKVAGVNPGFAAWTRTTEGVRGSMFPYKDSSAMASTTIFANTSPAANASTLNKQWISPPMKAGIAFVTTDTFSGQVRCQESAVNDNLNRQPICIKVYTEDGITLQATLFALAHAGPNTTEWNTALRNKIISNATVLGAAYTTVIRDILVIELGGQVDATGGTSVTGTQSWGSDSATDLTANDETVTAANNPWISFSRSLAFYGDGVGGGTCLSTNSGVGAAVWATSQAIPGTSTAPAVGVALWDAVGASVGASVITGAGVALWDAVGASTASSTAPGLGVAIWDVLGANTAISTLPGVGAALWDGLGSSITLSTMQASSASVLPALGSSASIMVMSGDGEATSSGSNGVITAISVMSGDSISFWDSIGSCPATSDLPGISGSTNRVLGVISALSVFNGEAGLLAESTGTITGQVTFSGIIEKFRPLPFSATAPPRSYRLAAPYVSHTYSLKAPPRVYRLIA